jgi:hypothetical protein
LLVLPEDDLLNANLTEVEGELTLLRVAQVLEEEEGVQKDMQLMQQLEMMSQNNLQLLKMLLTIIMMPLLGFLLYLLDCVTKSHGYHFRMWNLVVLHLKI